MPEKRMLIVDAEIAKKVDENRGDMSQSDFINFLIARDLKQEPSKTEPPKPAYVTMEEFAQFQQGIRELLRNFMEFFLSYGLELGKQPEDATISELSKQLQNFVTKVKPPA